ncbi:hypothetical protein TTHERM_00310910 (macronuclear) [Tetrahymena thermophila SB210]|uniref:Uncharacterized protein n=1 Tax=Tetrahymena thermophila (strain SB210) TaxID=312017 RepID=I7M971_TETTS|nr:hypothetical protein TTHERM_00310910 [Tetrahymena thermophila SB210]EAS00913.1 hypothetical protein TTHERM_00310910 [Tetrahymena thermophila SB210]|eukprot:XP_001021159.1 hypothetical protein TTHERM_00310910 [Tetrahymena thermophila SB210]
MSNTLLIKRDEHGENRFLKLSKFYQVCNQKFEDGFEEFKENIKQSKNQTLIKRQSEYMGYLKLTGSTLTQMVEQCEKLAALLQTSKYEGEKANFEMYFYHSFQILDYFRNNYIKKEDQNDNRAKKNVLRQVINVLFLKNQGHLLVYDLFIGWTTYYSQIFDGSAENQDKKVPLLEFSGKSRILYDQTFMKTSFALCGLICINPINLIQFVRDSRKQELHYQKLKNSYKNIINLDIEQQDYYWHFIDTFCHHAKQQKLYNHINIQALLSFIELSYIQMKAASDSFSTSSELHQLTLCANKNEYKQLFQFIQEIIIPYLKDQLEKLKKPENQDYIFKQIDLNTINNLENSFRIIREKMSNYNNKRLFQNEVIGDDVEDQEEKGIKTVINNPFYFLQI